jgi:receptor expression-enhancing protein 5/6
MREINTEKLAIYGVSILLVILAVPLLSRLPRTRGKNPIYHGAFLAGGVALLMLLPHDIQNEVFSPGGVIVIGTILPVYESILAVCTPGEEDDTALLQFWLASGTLSYCTEFIDEIRHVFPSGGEHWYEFEFFLTLWMLLPITDGATLIYDLFTEPYIAPVARKLKSKVEGWISLILTAVNTSYIWFVWFIFMSFPEDQRRFAVVAVGTIYPLAASTVAITTKTDGTDDTFWLTYWSCFSLLFLAMDYLENFVGHIRGFYSICLMATIYLFLPMFGGANVVFRRVLVPLSGQYENMLLHDAYLVRKGMEDAIPSHYHERVFKKAAEVFTGPSKDKKS